MKGSGYALGGAAGDEHARAIHRLLPIAPPPLDWAHEFIHQQHPVTEPRTEEPEEDPAPTFYDTGLDANEGLWLRSGWAGKG